MIRFAGKNDLKEIQKLYKELRPFDPDLEDNFAQQTWINLIADPQTHIIVADIEGVLASNCALNINNSIANGGRPFGIIEHVITSSNFRRMGLSQHVLKFAISLAWQKTVIKSCCYQESN